MNALINKTRHAFDKTVGFIASGIFRTALFILLMGLGIFAALLFVDIVSLLASTPIIMFISIMSLVGGLILLAINFIVPLVALWHYSKWVFKVVSKPNLIPWQDLQPLLKGVGLLCVAVIGYSLFLGPVFLSDTEAALLGISAMVLVICMWNVPRWRICVHALMLGGLIGIIWAFAEHSIASNHHTQQTTQHITYISLAHIAKEAQHPVPEEIRYRPGRGRSGFGKGGGLARGAARNIPILSAQAMNFGRLIPAHVGRNIAIPTKSIRVAVADFKAIRLTRQTSGANNPANPRSKGWTSYRGMSEQANIRRHHQQHRDEFSKELRNRENPQEYINLARNFLDTPPRGTLTYVRSGRNNPDQAGDIVRYHRESNTFAVKTKDGRIRTMMKPKEELKRDYFYNDIHKNP